MIKCASSGHSYCLRRPQDKIYAYEREVKGLTDAIIHYTHSYYIKYFLIIVNSDTVVYSI